MAEIASEQRLEEFLESFKYNKEIGKKRQVHDDILGGLTEEVYHMQTLDNMLGTFVSVGGIVELVKIAYQLGYIDSVNSVVFKEQE